MSAPSLPLSPVSTAPHPPRPAPPRPRRAFALGPALAALGPGLTIGLYCALPFMPSVESWLSSAGDVSLWTLDHPLGTDPRGRDLLTGIAHAQSVFVPFTVRAWLVALGIGGLIGFAAGWGPRWLGASIERLYVTVAAFPRLPFVLLIATAFDPSLSTAAIAVGAVFVPDVAGEVRARVAALRASAFVTASRAHGIGWTRVLGHHVGWLHLAPVLARHAAHIFAYVVIVEASLSYLARLGRYPIVGETGDRIRFGQLLVDAKSHLDPTLADLSTWWPLLVEAGFLAVVVGAALRLGDHVGRTLEG